MNRNHNASGETAQKVYGQYRSQLWREPEQLVVARVLYGEGRGEPVPVREAVAGVIRNRVDRPGWWGRSWKEVCLKQKQFSCLNRRDPNVDIIMSASISDVVFLECLGIAYGVMHNLIADSTDGATHYHDTSVQPYWAGKLQFIKAMGRLRLYR